MAKTKWPTVEEVVRETLIDLNTVVDNKKTIKEFNQMANKKNRIKLSSLKRYKKSRKS